MPQPLTTAHNGPALYSLIHKGIRDRLFKFSINAGRLDYADSLKVNEFNHEMNLLTSSISLHHTMEEKFIHPLISDRVPGGAVRLEEEHKLVEQQMSQMTAQLEGIRVKTGGFERCRDLGLEFYLSFNRFLAFFLEHINDEEERVQRTLYDLCTVEELTTTFGRILAGQKPEERMDNLKMVLTGANMDELMGLFIGAKFLMPPEEYQNSIKLAKTVLKPADWSILQTRAGLEVK
jgi:hypothetical protein